MKNKNFSFLWYTFAVVILLFISLQSVAKFTYISERGFYDGHPSLSDAYVYSLAYSSIAFLLSCRLIFIKNWMGIVLIFLSILSFVLPINGIVKQKNGCLVKELLPPLFENNSRDLKAYLKKYGEFPNEMIEFLAGKSESLIEYRLTCGTGKTNIVREFDGSGGWVYNPESGIFGINVKGMEQYTTNLTTYLGDVRMKTEKMIKK